MLVNGQSASASEIVSGAIQDHDRGLIVGETTFGKGLVQTQFPLSENTALLLTTARYYTPSGRLIQRDYKNETLWDYHYNPKPPQAPEVKLTDTGRQVYGGGGITPDVIIAEPKPDEFSESLDRRGVFYPATTGVGDFVRFYLGTRPNVTRDFSVVDDSGDLAQLRKYLGDQHIQFTEQDIQQNTGLAEVGNQARGLHHPVRLERRLQGRARKRPPIGQGRPSHPSGQSALCKRPQGSRGTRVDPRQRGSSFWTSDSSYFQTAPRANRRPLHPAIRQIV